MSGFEESYLTSALASSPPSLTTTEAECLAKAAWGLSGQAISLMAERDQTFYFRAEIGPDYILKLCHPSEYESVGDLQPAALRHIESVAPDLPVPRIVAAEKGGDDVPVKLNDGRRTVARLQTVVQGAPLATPQQATETIAAQIGKMVAAVNQALSTFTHPTAEHDLLWNVARLPTMEGLLDFIPEKDLQQTVSSQFAFLCCEYLPRVQNLPVAIIHNDVTAANVFHSNGGVSGLIDFGDMMSTYRVAEISGAAGYFLVDEKDPFRVSRAIAKAYLQQQPLTESERVLIPPLALARRLLSVLVGCWYVRQWPEKAEYKEPQLGNGLAIFKRLGGLSSSFVEHFWEIG